MAPLRRTGALLGRAVAYRDIRLGVVEDVLFDAVLGRLVGLEVRCGDGAARFLPFPACELAGDRLTVESALVFLERELDFYRLGGRLLSVLRGEPVTRSGADVGGLEDVLVSADGEVRGFLVRAQEGVRELEPSGDLDVGNDGLRRAV
jgi:sporulation protein YlmC with PRC-barrel domain